MEDRLTQLLHEFQTAKAAWESNGGADLGARWAAKEALVSAAEALHEAEVPDEVIRSLHRYMRDHGPYDEALPEPLVLTRH
jgi:hypothetical protein